MLTCGGVIRSYRYSMYDLITANSRMENDRNKTSLTVKNKQVWTRTMCIR